MTQRERYIRIQELLDSTQHIPQAHELIRALGVLILTPGTAEYLRAHDPKALRQADEAIAGKQLTSTSQSVTMGLGGTAEMIELRKTRELSWVPAKAKLPVRQTFTLSLELRAVGTPGVIGHQLMRALEEAGFDVIALQSEVKP